MSRILFFSFVQVVKEHGFKVGYSKVHSDGGEYIFYKDGIIISAESYDGFQYTAQAYLEVSSLECPNGWVSLDTVGNKMLITRDVTDGSMASLNEASQYHISEEWSKYHNLKMIFSEGMLNEFSHELHAIIQR